MKRWLEIALVIVLGFGWTAASAQAERLEAEQLLVTGEVESAQSQFIITPVTGSWRSQITYLAPEGERVAPGDLVAQFDGSTVESRQTAAEEDLAQYQATSQRDLAQLELDLDQAKLARRKAEIEAQTAAMKAQVPADFIGELEYEENQLQLAQSQNALEQANKKALNTERRLADKRLEVELGLRHKSEQLEQWAKMLLDTQVLAEQAGFVLHRQHPWTGNKYQSGDQVHTSWEIAMVADDQDLRVVAWVNAIDLPKLQAQLRANEQLAEPTSSAAGPTELPVSLYFDALPEQVVVGRLRSVSAAGENRAQWGTGLYHKAQVSLSEDRELGLLPGMSVLISMPFGDSL